MAGIIIYSPYRERFLAASSQADLRNIGTLYGSIDNQQPVTPMDKDFDRLIEAMQIIKPEERFYFAPAGQADPIEVAYSTVLPAAIKRNNLINGFFSVEVGTGNHLAVDHFRSTMRKCYEMLKLFNVHYIAGHRSNIKEFTEVRKYLEPIIDGSQSNWMFYKLQGDHNILHSSNSKPIAVIADWKEWQLINKIWLRTISNGKANAESIRPLIKYNKDIQFPEKFSHTIVMSSQKQSKNSIDKDNTFWGKVVIFDTYDENELQQMLEPLVIGHSNSLDNHIRTKIISYEPNKIIIQADTPEDQYAAIKIAYYRGWDVTINDKHSFLYNFGPGFCGLYLKSGKNLIEMNYVGPNKKWQGRAISFVGMFLAGVIIFFMMSRKRKINVC